MITRPFHKKSNSGNSYCTKLILGPLGPIETDVRKCILPNYVSFPLDWTPQPSHCNYNGEIEQTWYIIYLVITVEGGVLLNWDQCIRTVICKIFSRIPYSTILGHSKMCPKYRIWASIWAAKYGQEFLLAPGTRINFVQCEFSKKGVFVKHPNDHLVGQLTRVIRRKTALGSGHPLSGSYYIKGWPRVTAFYDALWEMAQDLPTW